VAGWLAQATAHRSSGDSPQASADNLSAPDARRIGIHILLHHPLADRQPGILCDLDKLLPFPICVMAGRSAGSHDTAATNFCKMITTCAAGIVPKSASRNRICASSSPP
jgi:hypothetical protein